MTNFSTRYNNIGWTLQTTFSFFKKLAISFLLLVATQNISAQTCEIETNLTTTPYSICVAGTAPTLSVTVSGAISYQWFSNTTNSISGGTSISGATSSSYSPSVSSAGTTYYFVVIQTDCENELTSNVASVVVTAAPSAGTLSGTAGICVGGTTTFTSDGNTGGAWTSGTTAVATVDESTGEITGVSSGTSTITYTVTGTGGCSNATATRVVTVTAAPSAGTLSETAGICVGGTTTFTSDGNTGGAWTSGTTAVATVDESTGEITGVSSGTSTITYTVTGTGGCSNATATRVVTVTAAPSAGTLSGTAGICVGGTTTFTSDGNTGGAWTSGTTDVATVDESTGEITGVSSGTSTITYTITGTGGCSNATATRVVTVTAAPSAGVLSGASEICSTSTTTFESDGDAGVWSSVNPSIATINSSSGIITPVSAGTATIRYVVAGTGGCVNDTATKTITISAPPSAGTLSGTRTICERSTSQLASTISGGVWSTEDVTVATVDNSSGLVTAISGGTSYIKYTVLGTEVCESVSDSLLVTVTPGQQVGVSVASDAENNIICIGTRVKFTAAPSNGGGSPIYQWSVNDSLVGTNNRIYITTSLSNNDKVKVSMTSSLSGCLLDSPSADSINMTVNPLPEIAPITGDSIICSSGVQLSNTTSNGFWSSANSSVATIDETGYATKVSIGSATIRYTLTDEATGCTDSVSKLIQMVTAPAKPDSVYGLREVCRYINQGTQIVYRIKPVTGAASYGWYLPSGMNAVSKPGKLIYGATGDDSLVVTFNDSFYRWSPIYVTAISAEGCQSEWIPLWIFKTIPSLSSISGATNVCPFIGKDTVIYYSVDSNASFASYTWVVPTGVTIVSGWNSHVIGVKFLSSFVSGSSLKVTGVSNCGSSSSKYLTLSKLLPSTPGVITGTTVVCSYLGSATPAKYKISAVANAASYLWTLPTGAHASGSLTADSILVTFDANFSGGVLKVKAVSNCYTSVDRTLTLTAPPYPVPGVITGPSNPCAYINVDVDTVYSINKVSGATGYIWTLPTGMTIVDRPGDGGAEDTLIRVSFSSDFSNRDTLKVQSTGCNASAARILVISKAAPTSISTLFGRASVCSTYHDAVSQSDTVIYSTRKVANASTYTWTIPRLATNMTALTSEDTFVVVKYEPSFITGAITVKANNYCSSTAPKSLTVTKVVAAAPAAIQKTFTPSVLAVSNLAGVTKDTLRIRKVANATSYVWSLKVGTKASIVHMNAGQSAENDTAVIVQLNPDFAKDTVSVVSMTICNVSIPKTLPLSAMTYPATVASISGSTSPCVSDEEEYTATAGTASSTQAPTYKFRWTKPANTTITYSNSDSSTIRLRYDAGFTGSAISVKGVTILGLVSATATTITLKYAAATPSNITSTNFSPCVGASVTYTVQMPTLTSSQREALKYRWTKPANSDFVDAATDSSWVKIQFNAGYTGGSISVKAVTACNVLGAAKSVSLTTLALPPTPASIAGSNAGCIGSSITYTASQGVPTTSQASGASFRWTIPNNTSIISINGLSDSSKITLQLNNNFSGGIISVKSQSACGAVSSSAKTLTLLSPTSLPPTPASITGTYSGCVGGSQNYTATSTASSSQFPVSMYRWTKPNNTSIANANSDSSQITVSFNAGYTGGSLTVKGQTACGVLGAAKVQALTLATSGCAGSFAKNSNIGLDNSIVALPLEVSIAPNPSSSDFRLLMISKEYNGKKVSIRLMDNRGTLIKVYQLLPTEVLSFGAELKSGTYFIQINDGKSLINKKLVKI